VRAAGVLDEQVTEETAALAGLYAPIRDNAERVDLSLGQARTLLSALATAEMERERRLQELRFKYETEPSTPEVHLRWREIAGPTEFQSEQELDNILASLKERIVPHLDGETIITIE